MRYRLLACVAAVCLAATVHAQTLTVEQLITFVKSQLEFIKEKKGNDKDLAGYLAKVKLKEKLEQRVIEDLEGLGAGPLTKKALEKLAEQSQSLTAANIQAMLPDIPEPPPSSEEQAAILDEVRHYVANYTDSLPDFICTEVEYRNIAARPGTHGTRFGSDPSFQQYDTITSKLTYFDHKEEKKVILHGNTPTIKEYGSLGGSTSTGDFGDRLKMLFERRTEARFEWSHWSTLRGRPTMAFGFQVDQAHSKLTVSSKEEGSAKDQFVDPAYYGQVFVDRETHEVTRLEIHADDLGAGFPVKRVFERLDYKYAEISGQQFLLPFSGEVQMDGSDMLSKNDLQFEFYKRYSADSAISYDIPADITPIPADQLKEKPAVDCKDPKNKDNEACKVAPPTTKKK